MLPLVSIIIPSYNRASLITETLDSIYQQTYQSLELIIIDDGSLDNTKEIVHEWISKYSSRFENAVFHSFLHNKGKPEAVNFGFDMAKGDFVMVFDSDDLLLHGAITVEIGHLMAHPMIDCLCAGAYLMNGNVPSKIQFHPLRDQGNIENVKTHYGDLFLKGNPIISSTVVMKKSVVKGTGYLNPSLRISHDWDYWIRISQKFTIGFLNIPVMYYRTSADGSISQNKLNLFSDVLKIISLYKDNYSRSEISKVIVYQIKYHLWLAFNDRNIGHMLLISISGFLYFTRFLFGK